MKVVQEIELRKVRTEGGQPRTKKVLHARVQGDTVEELQEQHEDYRKTGADRRLGSYIL